MVGFIIAASPFITSALTGLIKKLPLFSSLSDSARTPLVRALAALIAVVYILVGFWMTGQLDQNLFGAAVQTFVFALLAWLSSLGIFHAFFQKN